MSEGLDSFEDHEKLELVLHYPIKRKDTNGTAHGLLARFGTLSEVFDASVQELCEVEDVGRSAALFLRLIYGIGTRYIADRCCGSSDGASTVDAVGMRYAAEHAADDGDRYSVVMFDDELCVLGAETLQSSDTTVCDIDAGAVARLLFRSGCHRFMIVRNIHGGIGEPSMDDRYLASALISMFAPIGRELIEYIVVSHDGYYPVLRYFSDFETDARDICEPPEWRY